MNTNMVYKLCREYNKLDDFIIIPVGPELTSKNIQPSNEDKAKNKVIIAKSLLTNLLTIPTYSSANKNKNRGAKLPINTAILSVNKLFSLLSSSDTQSIINQAIKVTKKYPKYFTS